MLELPPVPLVKHIGTRKISLGTYISIPSCIYCFLALLFIIDYLFNLLTYLFNLLTYLCIHLSMYLLGWKARSAFTNMRDPAVVQKMLGDWAGSHGENDGGVRYLHLSMYLSVLLASFYVSFFLFISLTIYLVLRLPLLLMIRTVVGI